jgi:hypothetical protein
MQKMAADLPMTATRFQALSDDEVAVFELFSNRFAKLQDAMATKLFPLVLEIAKEPEDLPAFIDKLNRLEKIGAIPSTHQWLAFRKIRNQFAHDYPEDSEQNAAVINLAYEQASELMTVLMQVKSFLSGRV